MAWFSRRKTGAGPGQEKPSARDQRRARVAALEEWISTRHGIEVFVEPQTTVTSTTMLLVAHDGEFTRRPVASPAAARSFAVAHSLPIYDANLVGYPQRMRDYSRRQTVLRERADRETLDDPDAT
jgi:hypothetical protein